MAKVIPFRWEHQEIEEVIRNFRAFVASSVSRPIGCGDRFPELDQALSDESSGLRHSMLVDFGFERAGSSVSIHAYTLPTGRRFYVACDQFDGTRIVAAAPEASYDTEFLIRLFDFQSDPFAICIHLGCNVPDLVGVSSAWPFAFWKERFLHSFRGKLNFGELEESLGLHYALEELGEDVDVVFPPNPHDDDDPDSKDKVDPAQLIDRCLAVPERQEILLERLAHVWLAGASFKRHEIRRLVSKVRGEDFAS